MAKILLRFAEDLAGQPITAQIILEHKIPISIVTANITSKGGEFLAEIPDESLEIVVNAFREKGLTVSLPKLIEIDPLKFGVLYIILWYFRINIDKYTFSLVPSNFV